VSFSGDLEKFARQANGNLDLVLRKVSFDIAESLIKMSPVDTGRFRANWFVGIGSANGATNTGTDKTGGRTLARIQTSLSVAKAQKPVFITNSLPYAQRLEYGWSKQAPAGMVRVTAARFSSFVQAAAVGLK